MSQQPAHARASRAGLIFGVTCYTVWGLFPLYVVQLEFASALEIVAHRILWSLLLCLALLALAWLSSRGQTHFTVHGTRSALWLASTGVATTLPLITFAAAARRLPLSTLGLLQYIGPSLQFVIAVVVAHEPMSPSRWIGFAMIWAALLLVSVDALHAQHRRRRQAAANFPELEPLG